MYSNLWEFWKLLGLTHSLNMINHPNVGRNGNRNLRNDVTNVLNLEWIVCKFHVSRSFFLVEPRTFQRHLENCHNTLQINSTLTERKEMLPFKSYLPYTGILESSDENRIMSQLEKANSQTTFQTFSKYSIFSQSERNDTFPDEVHR